MAPQQPESSNSTSSSDVINSPNETSSSSSPTSPTTDSRATSKFAFITKPDYLELSRLYDKDNNGKLDDNEIQLLIEDYNSGKLDKESRIYEIIRKYDLDGNGTIDLEELENMKSAFNLAESDLRYAGYSVSLARLFRYLAFTSDFGEALRPVAHRQLVNATYAVAFGYCIADVGYEAYKLQKNHYKNEKMEPMTLTQCIVERSTFQLFASLLGPAVVIHQTVHFSKLGFAKIGRFTKWGPSLVGLSLIPFLPVLLDEPVERIVEYGFHHYGPWAKKDHEGHDGATTSETKKDQ